MILFFVERDIFLRLNVMTTTLFWGILELLRGTAAWRLELEEMQSAALWQGREQELSWNNAKVVTNTHTCIHIYSHVYAW